MRVIPIDDRKMTLTVATPPRRQSKPNPFTGEIDWDVDLLAVTSDGKTDLLRVTVPDSGMPKNLAPLTAVEVEGFIARVWEKQDGRHGIMFACDAMRPVVAANGAAAKASAAAS
jgi:hypothetical protein